MIPAAKLLRWKNRPDLFVREVFDKSEKPVEPDLWQDKVLKAAPHERAIAMRACKGPGKSCVESWLALWFMLTRPHAKVPITSGTVDQLKDTMWPEIAMWMKRSTVLDMEFEWTNTRVFHKRHRETWFMSARGWSKSASREEQGKALAGLHADHLLFILDEAGDIPDGVAATAEAALSTGGDTRILIGGNPTQLEGPLYRACHQDRDKWFVVEVTGDPDNPERSPRIDIEWAREQIRRYGRDSPFVKVNVLGEFPQAGMMSLVGLEDVTKAMARNMPVENYSHAQKRIGVDAARFGDDDTIILPRQGLRAFPCRRLKHASTNEIVGAVMHGRRKWESEIEFIDGTGGYGAGVVDGLRTAGANPIEVQFNGRADDGRYANKRAEMWFRMADWIKGGGKLPRDDDLVRELTTVQYSFRGDKFIIEPKEMLKKRLGYSPDTADALALTFAYADEPGDGVCHKDELGIPLHMHERLKNQQDWDYDPLDPGRM